MSVVPKLTFRNFLRWAKPTVWDDPSIRPFTSGFIVMTGIGFGIAAGIDGETLPLFFFIIFSALL